MDHNRPSKFFSRENFHHTMATSMFVGASLLSPAVDAQEPQTDPNKPLAQKIEHVDPVKEPRRGQVRRAERQADKLSADERAEINQHMRNEGARHADHIAAGAGNSYSQDLNTLEQRIETYFATNKDFANEKIVIMDPVKFSAYETLMNGLKGSAYDGEDVFKASLRRDDHAHYGDTSSSYIGGAMTRDYSTDYATAHGHASSVIREDNASMFMVPAPSHTRQYDIEGLSKEEELEFINLHEAYHTMDNRKKHYDIPEDVYKMGGIGLEYYENILNTEGATTYIEMRHHSEVFADVAALGDMIRLGGHDVNILDSTSEWRADNTADYIHMSAIVLDDFKKEIDDMGLENFKNLSDAEARKMYNDVVVNTAMDRDQFKKMFEYVRAQDNETPESEAFLEKWEKEKETDPEVQKVDKFITKIQDHYDCSIDKESKLEEREEFITEQVKDFDAMKALTDKAYQIGKGRITPESMVNAHSALQDDLRDMRKKDSPNEDIYTAKMEMLQDTLIHDVPKMDYVCTNASYGVKPNALKM